MGRYKFARKDDNHNEIADAFKTVGAVVDDVSMVRGLGYDMVIGLRNRVILVEVKNGDRSKSKQALTESEKSARDRHGDHFFVVTSVKDVIDLLALIRP